MSFTNQTIVITGASDGIMPSWHANWHAKNRSWCLLRADVKR